LDWQFATDRPIYAQIVEYIQRGILAGVYPPGSSMPSVRTLALEAEVNPNTMQRALAELEAQALLHTHRTSGRTVTFDESLISKLRESAAQALIDQYFVGMQGLGIKRDEAGRMLAERTNDTANDTAQTPAVAHRELQHNALDSTDKKEVAG
jgi:DNA-binding transcriptional regulator YhcF (GntR family)